MQPNFIYLLAVGLIPLIIGSIWYNPKVFGTAWMRASGKTEKELAGGNMAVILGLSYLLSVLLAAGLMGSVIHQSGVSQLFADGSPESIKFLEDFMSKYGRLHRTAGHGALHGGLFAVLVALPLIAINALFERRGGKYIGIHFGYWFVTLTLMGTAIGHFV